MISSEESPLAP
jgi:hypothetical protein